MQLTATPADGYTFTSWSGDATGSTNPITISMSDNKNITANFTAIPPPVELGSIRNFGAYGGNAGITNQGVYTVINNGAIGTTAAPTLITGFHDVNSKINNNESLFTFLKIEYNPKMEDYIYNKYLREEVEKMIDLYKQTTCTNDISNLKINVSSDIQIKSADKIRLEKNNTENLN